MGQDKYYGKYRGKVTSISDPEKMGRIKANVPAINGAYETGWCLPCFPYAGTNHAVKFLPELGDVVWIEFERGEIDHPIWVGSPMCTGQDEWDDAYVIRTPYGQLVFTKDAVFLMNRYNHGLFIGKDKVVTYYDGGSYTQLEKDTALMSSDMKTTVQSRQFVRLFSEGTVQSEQNVINLQGNTINIKGNSTTISDSGASWTPSSLKSEIDLAKQLP